MAGLAAAGQRAGSAAAISTPSIPGPPPSGVEHRAGSAISSPQSTATAPVGVDPKAFNDVISQLESIGAIDPAQQARLMEDLKQTDPSLWPLMLDAFRASLAYHERIAAKPGSGTGPLAADAALLANGANDSRGNLTIDRVPPGTLPQGADRPPANAGPWSALNVPSTPAGKSQAENIVSARPPEGRTPSPATAPARQGGADRAPTAEPGKFPIADARRPAATMLGPAAVAKATTGIPTATGPLDAGSAAAPSKTSDVVSAIAESPSSKVQQASFQTKLADDDFEGHLSAAIRALETKTQKPPEGADDVAAHAYLRMLYLAAGRREDALRPIAGINPAEQDYWAKQLWSLATFMDSERTTDAPRRAAEAAQHLNEAAGKLAELATLVVKNLAFCTEVRSYGVFTRFKDYEFTAGQRLLLYAEVENFKSDHTRKGYHTALKCSYQILDAQGRRVATDEASMMEEYCQNPRRDYFLNYEHLRLPTPMYEGRYTLQLTIEDTLSQKIGQSSIEFTVKAK